MTQRENILQELNELQSGLAKIPATNVYSVPQDYFETLLPQVMARIKAMEATDAVEELAHLSPMLSTLKKDMPFSVPQGYFENLTIPSRIEKPVGKVVSLTQRKWYRYATAAILTGFVVLAGFLFIGKNASNKAPLAKFTKDVKKMDESQKADLMDFIDAGLNGKEQAKVNTDNKSKSIRDLLEDIPEEELMDFQEQTEDVQEVLMTN